MNTQKEDFEKKFTRLLEVLEGDGPMWFWNGDKQIYVRDCKEEIWDWIEAHNRKRIEEIKEETLLEVRKEFDEWWFQYKPPRDKVKGSDAAVKIDLIIRKKLEFLEKQKD